MMPRVTLTIAASALALSATVLPAGMAVAQQRANEQVPYGAVDEAQIRKTVERLHGYLADTTPMELVKRGTNDRVRIEDAGADTVFRRGDFGINSYEWGVTYSGMLAMSNATADPRYAKYARERADFIAAVADRYRGANAAQSPVRGLLAPNSLDDSGSMAAALIRIQRRGDAGANLRPLIDNLLTYISTRQFRLADGTLARNRPLSNALWLDDLYMGVPALSQMYALTGQRRYIDDAARQVLQFGKRMFLPEKGVFMHGWIQDMKQHPAYHWGRANGWAVLATADLLEVMPENHPLRAAVLAQFKAHLMGLAKYQSGTGLWHQLIDRNDSYLETSASAMFVFGLARAINKGWLDEKAYGPAVIAGWQAIAGKVNSRGQVEDVCVGTGMAFEPVFYYRRPVSPTAPHGPGPVLLAAAEIIQMLHKQGYVINDGALMHVSGRSSN